MKSICIIGFFILTICRVLAWNKAPNIPEVSCPSPKTVDTDPGTCSAIVKEIDPVTESENFSKVEYQLTGATNATGSGSASGQSFTTGTTTVRYFMKDDPAVTCSFTVTVKDKSPPVPTLPQLPDLTAVCSLTITVLPAATDNCSGNLLAKTDDPLTYNVPGNYEIEWIFEDDFGNITKQKQNIKVTKGNRKISPLEKALPDLVGSCAVNITTIPEAVSGCGNIIKAEARSPVIYNKPGLYIVTWIFYDGVNDSLKQFQRVYINDKEKPVPDADHLPDITGECAIEIINKPTATDNCSGKITAITQDPLKYSSAGSYTITWTFKDQNGNAESQEQKVILNAGTGNIVPEKTSLPDIISDCAVTITEYPRATKSCSGKITATSSSSLTYNKPGTYSITWVYDDGLGDTVHQKQKVIIKDDIAPEPDIADLPDISGSCSVFVSSIPTATDNCSGKIKASTNDPLEYNEPGEYFISWLYKDENGNKTNQKQRIRVLKASGKPVPVLAGLADIRSECSVSITNIPEAESACGAVIKAVTNDPLTYNKPGKYIITWIYPGDNGLEQTQLQRVIITDTEPPVPDRTQLPDISAACSVTVTEIPTATDNCGTIVKGITSDPISFTSIGSHVIRWTFTDGAGNKTVQNQKIQVTAGTQPILPTLTNLPDLIGNCSVSVTIKPTAETGCGKLITASTTDPLTYNKNGQYSIQWKYTDGNGNEMIQTQRIIIHGNTIPVPDVSDLPDINGICSVAVTNIPTASDGCSGKIRATTSDPVLYHSPGKYMITWVYSDERGNTFTQHQKVNVLSGKPEPVQKILPDLKSQCSITVISRPTALSQCGETITGTTDQPLAYDKPGDYIITWTYTDKSGNTVTQQQHVLISDTRPPVPTLMTLPDIISDCAFNIIDQPTALDDCGGLITGVTMNPAIFQPGTYTVNWMYSDPAGNISTQKQKVVINSLPLTVNIAPNPSSSEFRIQVKSCNRDAKIFLRVFDAQGRIFENRLLNAFENVRLGSGYSSGIYILQVVQQNEVVTRKLFKN